MADKKYNISSESSVLSVAKNLGQLTIDNCKLKIDNWKSARSKFMETFIYKTKAQMGAAAAAAAAEIIKQAIKIKKQANIILATGTSQFETLKNLVAAPHQLSAGERTKFALECLPANRFNWCGGIDWQKVIMFHLDEYIGLPADHPASFRRFLKERFVDKVPGLAAVHFVNGDAKDPQQECRRVSAIIARHPIDVALLGIGENGHLAFNDPPADFVTFQPYIIVQLDERCRRQQLGEGWFDTLEQVPRRAISMSIRQIMKSACLIVSVPEKRKAEAVKNALEGPVTPMCPASILQQHKNCKVFMDEQAASLL